LQIVPRHAVTVEECLKFQKDAKHKEGFVIAFADGRRVKIKTDWYMTLAKIMSHLSPISIWETMSNGIVQQAFLVQIPEELRPLAEQYKAVLELQYKKVREKVVQDCEAFIAKHGRDRKTIALNREPLNGTLAYKGVFSVLDKNEASLNQIVMNAIYPASNEFVAI